MDLPDGLAFRLLSASTLAADEVIATLSAAERERMAAFPIEKRRREFALGRAALRLLLAECFGGRPEEQPLRIDDDHAVVLEGRPGAVSIAHSGDRAVAAYHAGGPVGADVERIQPRHPGLSRFLLHESERALIAGPDSDAALILIWTLKEAVLKGLRTGFRVSPKQIVIRLEEAPGRAEAFVAGQHSWQVRFIKDGDYFASVAFPSLAGPSFPR
jgi:4'-phosphopantetheinyl transferase